MSQFQTHLTRLVNSGCLQGTYVHLSDYPIRSLISPIGKQYTVTPVHSLHITSVCSQAITLDAYAHTHIHSRCCADVALMLVDACVYLLVWIKYHGDTCDHARPNPRLGTTP